MYSIFGSQMFYTSALQNAMGFLCTQYNDFCDKCHIYFFSEKWYFKYINLKT